MARVFRNLTCVRAFLTDQEAINFVADQTGKHPEFVAEETRQGWPVLQDDGDQTEWRIEP